jgi:translation initiation factor IF-2
MFFTGCSILSTVLATLQVDRLFGWKTCRNAPIRKAMKQQSKDVKNEFNMKVTQVVKNILFLFISCGRLFL